MALKILAMVNDIALGAVPWGDVFSVWLFSSFPIGFFCLVAWEFILPTLITGLWTRSQHLVGTGLMCKPTSVAEFGIWLSSLRADPWGRAPLMSVY